MLSGVMAIEQTARNFGLALSTARSIRSCSKENSTSHFLTAAINLLFAMILLESLLRTTFAMSRRRWSALSAIGWETKTRGLAVTSATAQCRRRRPRRIGRRRESSVLHQGHLKPLGFPVRAQATPDVTSIRQVLRRHRIRAAESGSAPALRPA